MGCKKPATNPSVYMKATINGQTFFGSNCVSTVANNYLFINGGNLTDTIGPSQFPQINLILNTSGSTLTGTYVIDGVNNKAKLDSAIYVEYSSYSGTVTISSAKASYISGSFQFTCSDSTKVTNGAFTASY